MRRKNMNRKEEKGKPDFFSSLWIVYKVSTASLERLFMFKYSSEEKQEPKFRTVWTLKESTENVKSFSHTGNQWVSSLIKEKKKSFVAYESGKKKFELMFVISVNYPCHLIFILGGRQYSIMNQGTLFHFLISYSSLV